MTIITKHSQGQGQGQGLGSQGQGQGLEPQGQGQDQGLGFWPSGPRPRPRTNITVMLFEHCTSRCSAFCLQFQNIQFVTVVVSRQVAYGRFPPFRCRSSVEVSPLPLAICPFPYTVAAAVAYVFAVYGTAVTERNFLT